MPLTIAISDDLTSDVYRHSLAIRRAVFIQEQGVSEDLEIDDEADSVYFLLRADDQPVATARVKIKGSCGKVQRVAVLQNARGTGAGREIMIQIEDWARANGLQQLILGAQWHAIGFYEKLGYEICSDEYLDANIPHKDMRKTL